MAELGCRIFISVFSVDAAEGGSALCHVRVSCSNISVPFIGLLLFP